MRSHRRQSRDHTAARLHRHDHAAAQADERKRARGPDHARDALTKGILPMLSEVIILKFADEEISTVGQVADFPADPRAWKNI